MTMSISDFARRNADDWRDTRGICALLGRWERAAQTVATWRAREANLSANQGARSLDSTVDSRSVTRLLAAEADAFLVPSFNNPAQMRRCSTEAQDAAAATPARWPS